MSARLMLASLAITCTATPVLASSQEMVSVEVSVEDLDLSTTKGQNLLNTRVSRAAKKICRTYHIGLAARALEMECVKSVLARTKPQVEVAIANSRSQTRIASVQVSKIS